MRATALRLIRANGRQLAFQRTTQGTLDVPSGRPAPPSIITAIAWAVVLPFSKGSNAGPYGAKHLADKLAVQQGENLVLIAPTGMTVTGAGNWTPLPNDELTTVVDGYTRWKIGRCQSLDPDGSGPILHAAVLVQ